MPLLLASASAPRPDLRAHRQARCRQDHDQLQPTPSGPGQPRVQPAMMPPAGVVTSQSPPRLAQEPVKRMCLIEVWSAASARHQTHTLSRAGATLTPKARSHLPRLEARTWSSREVCDRQSEEALLAMVLAALSAQLGEWRWARVAAVLATMATQYRMGSRTLMHG